MKRTLAILTGIITTMGILVVFALATELLFTSPKMIDGVEPSEIWKNIPIATLILRLLSATVSVFIGTILSTKIDRKNIKINFIIISSVFTLFATINFLGIKEPIWFWIIMIMTFYPVTFIAYKFLQRKLLNTSQTYKPINE